MLDQDSERRVYPRFAAPKGTIVAWHRFNKRAVSVVDNLGLGGLFIRTPDPPPVGTFVQLLIDAPTGEVRARAAVQRNSPKTRDRRQVHCDGTRTSCAIRGMA